MQNNEDAEFDKMSVRELLDLQAALHTAIRAAIREKNERMSAPIQAPVVPQRGPIDLERERDAWLAARRKG